MKLRLRHVFACSVVVLCLAVTSVLASQSVVHAWKHAHHQATTHATPICTWMCAAGQVVQSLDFGLETTFLSLYQASTGLPLPVLTLSSPSPLSRAPPQTT